MNISEKENSENSVAQNSEVPQAKREKIEELIEDVVSKNLKLPQRQKVIISENPLVFTIDNYLTHEECDHFIKLSENNLNRAFVSDNSTGMISSGRTGLNYWVDHHRDEITTRVGERIAKEVGHPLENAEKYQIIYYGETQEYRRHFDSWEA